MGLFFTRHKKMPIGKSLLNKEILSMKTNHKITTRQVSSRVTLIFVDGELAMVTALTDERYKKLLADTVFGMMDATLDVGIKGGIEMAIEDWQEPAP